MKAVLISIQPKWCELIVSGRKTVEVRKTMPNIEVPFKCYIYQTKSKDNSIYKRYKVDDMRCGKVIGEFICDCIISHCEMANADIAEQQGCIKREFLLEYSNGKELYGWHISNLKIYDTPKELSDFRQPDWYRDCKKECKEKDELEYYRCPTRNSHKADPMCGWCRKKGETIKNAPQSYMFVNIED